MWQKIRSNRRSLLFFLFAIGLIVRCVFVALYPGTNYFEGSSLRYLNVAQNMIVGKGMSIYVDTARISSPVKQFVNLPFIDKPALYPWLLSVSMSIFGSSLIMIQLVHALLMALIGPLFFLTYERLTKNSAYAIICGIGGAIWLNSARFEVTILPEALVALPIAITLYLFSQKKSSSSGLWKNGIIAGVMIGIGTLLRADVAFLPIFLFVGLAFIFGRKYSFQMLFPFLVGFIIVMGVQTGYNYNASGGKFLPLGYSNGIAAFEGISQFGDTLGTVYSDNRLKILEDQADLYYPRGPERDQERTRKALEIIKERPIWFVKTVIKRIPLLIIPRGLFIVEDGTPTKKTSEDFAQKFPASLFREFRETPGIAIVKLGSSLLGLILLVFSLLGCWKWRKNYTFWMLPFSIVAYFFLSHLPVNVEPRYFYPAVPFLIPLAGTFFIKKWSVRK